MRRFVLIVIAGAVVAASTGPALAKGPDVRVLAEAVITGPGLEGPVVITGDVSAYGFDGFESPHNELTDVLLRSVGLLDWPDIGWYELAPDPSATLGPGYQITYSFAGGHAERFVDLPLLGPGARVDLTVPFRQVVYLYAGRRPMVYTPPGQFFLTTMVGEWWSAPPSLFTWLVAHGVPPTPSGHPAVLRVPVGFSRL